MVKQDYWSRSSAACIGRGWAVAVVLAVMVTVPISASGQDFFDAIGRLLDGSSNQAVPAAVDGAGFGPELPVDRPIDEVDATERLIGSQVRAIRRTLLEGNAILARRSAGQPVMDAELSRVTAELRRLVRVDPDEFVWTNRNRWTSARRLARELLFALDPGEAGDTAVAQETINRIPFPSLARAALRSESSTVSRQLLRAWARSRRDAGMPGLSTRVEPALVFDSARRSPVLTSQPVALPQWVQRTRHDGWNDAVAEITELSRDRRSGMIPACSPAVSGSTVVWRTGRGLQAVDMRSGETVWNASLADAFSETSDRLRETQQRRVSFRIGGAIQPVNDDAPIAHEIFAGGGRADLTADDRSVFVVVDPQVRSPLLTTRRFSFRNTPGRDGPSALAHNYLRAINAKTGRTEWELGGPEERDAFERPVAGTFFLGAPAVTDGRLCVICERRGEVQLRILDSRSGDTIWVQPLAATELPIHLDLTRRFWSQTPVIRDGIAVCPTGVGWVVAVDIDGQELLWAQRVTEHPRKLPRYGNPGLGRVGDRWQPRRPIIAGDLVWVFPPESTNTDYSSSLGAGFAFDLLTGAVVYEVDREDAIVPVSIVDHADERPHVILAGRDFVRAIRPAASNGLVSSTLEWQRDFGPGRTLTGRPVRSGADLHVPINGDELWTLRVGDGGVVAKRTFPNFDQLGNLLIEGDGLIGCSPRCLARLINRSDLITDESDSPHDRLLKAQASGDQQLASDVVADWAALESEARGRLLEGRERAFLRMASKTLGTAYEDGVTPSMAVLDALEQLTESDREKRQLDRFRALSIEANDGAFAAAMSLLSLVEQGDLSNAMVDCIDKAGGSAVPRRARFDRLLSSEFVRLKLAMDASERTLFEEAVADFVRSDRSIDQLLVLANEPAGAAAAWRLISTSDLDRAARLDACCRFLAACAGGRFDEAAREFVASHLDWLGSELELPSLPRWSAGTLELDRAGIGSNRSVASHVELLGRDRLGLATRIRLEVPSQIQTVLVREAATDRLLATLPITTIAGRHSDGEVHAWIDGNQLFVAARGSLHAYRVDDWSPLWTAPVTSNVAFHRSVADLSVEFVRPRDLPDHNAPRMTSVVAIAGDVVVMRQRAALVALDRATGQPCWERELMLSERVLGATNRQLIVSADGAWCCLDLIDGQTRPLELPDRSTDMVAVLADAVVTVRPDGYSGPVAVTSWSLSTRGDRVVAVERWSQEIANDAQVGLVTADRIGVAETAGVFSLIDLVSGDRTSPVTLPHLLQNGRAKQAVRTVRLGGRLIVASHAVESEVGYDFSGNQANPISGLIASIDLASGEAHWIRSDLVSTLVWGETFSAPALFEAPVLVLLDRGRRMLGNTPITTFHITVLDHESGRTLLDESVRLAENQVTQAYFDAADQSVVLRLSNTKLRLRETREPETE